MKLEKSRRILDFMNKVYLPELTYYLPFPPPHLYQRYYSVRKIMKSLPAMLFVGESGRMRSVEGLVYYVKNSWKLNEFSLMFSLR